MQSRSGRIPLPKPVPVGSIASDSVKSRGCEKNQNDDPLVDKSNVFISANANNRYFSLRSKSRRRILSYPCVAFLRDGMSGISTANGSSVAYRYGIDRIILIVSTPPVKDEARNETFGNIVKSPLDGYITDNSINKV